MSVIDVADFEKLGCDAEKCFRKFIEALVIDITCILSKFTRRMSTLFGFDVLQFEKESTEKPAETVQKVSFVDVSVNHMNFSMIKI